MTDGKWDNLEEDFDYETEEGLRLMDQWEKIG
jgi:hypothetical protein